MKDREHFMGRGKFGESAALEVCHQDDGEHNLIGRKAENETGKDGTIQSHKACQWIQTSGKDGEESLRIAGRWIRNGCEPKKMSVCYSNVGSNPYEDSGRSCSDQSASEDKQCTVKKRMY